MIAFSHAAPQGCQLSMAVCSERQGVSEASCMYLCIDATSPSMRGPDGLEWRHAQHVALTTVY